MAPGPLSSHMAPSLASTPAPCVFITWFAPGQLILEMVSYISTYFFPFCSSTDVLFVLNFFITGASDRPVSAPLDASAWTHTLVVNTSGLSASQNKTGKAGPATMDPLRGEMTRDRECCPTMNTGGRDK